MAAITDLATASSVATGDYLVISQGGTDRKVVADKFAIHVAGTWTPTLLFAGGNSGITYSAQVGNYVKCGNLVMISARVALTSKGSSTGTCYIGNFPYTVGGAAGIIYVWPVDWDTLASTYLDVQLQSTTGWAYAALRGITAAAASMGTLTNSAIANTTSISFTGMYYV